MGYSRPYSSLGPYDPLTDPLGLDSSRSYLGGHQSAAAGLIGATTSSTGAGVGGVDGITAALRDTNINSFVDGVGGVVGDDRNRYLASRRFVVRAPSRKRRQIFINFSYLRTKKSFLI